MLPSYRDTARQLFMVLSAMLIVACAHTPNPVGEAQGIELKAQAAYGEWVIAEERMVAILHNAAVPENIKDEMKKIHDALNLRVEQMERQRVNLANLKVSSPEDVPAALLALDEIFKEVRPGVTDFKAKVDAQEAPQ